MQQCPKCGSGVSDERTTCHICFAELGANAQTAGPAGLNFATPQSAAVTPEPLAPGAAPPANPAAIPVPPPPARAAGIPGIPGIPTPQQAPLTQQPAAPQVPGLPGIYAQQQQQQDTSAAQPNYLRGDTSAMAPQSMGGGEMRVSLTGEVIQGPASTPQISRMTGVSAAAPPRPGGPPMPARRTAPARGPVREEVEGQKSGGGVVFLVLLLLIVLGGGGFGGWYWYNNRTNPKDQAIKFVNATKAMDWAALHPLIAFSDADKAKYPTPASFADAQNKQLEQAGPFKDMLKGILGGISDVTAGEPTIDGNKAKVPISMKISMMGQSTPVNQTMPMVKEGGVWKLDATSAASGQGGVSMPGMLGGAMQDRGMSGMMGPQGGGTSGGGRRNRRSRR